MKNLLAYFFISFIALTTFCCSEEETLISEDGLSTPELTSINNASSSSSISFDKSTGILQAPRGTLIMMSLSPQDVDGTGLASIVANGGSLALSTTWTRSGGSVERGTFSMPFSGQVEIIGRFRSTSARDEVTAIISGEGFSSSITLDGDTPVYP